jgi:tRNA U55 pseudouridine synthase TruB
LNLPLIGILTALDDILVLAVDSEMASMLRQGKALKAKAVCNNQNFQMGQVIALALDQEPIALVKYEKGLLKPFRVFPAEN